MELQLSDEMGRNDGLVALAERLRGTGLDATFLGFIRDRIIPGSSALLAVTSDVDLDEVRPIIESGLARGDVDLIYVRLPEDSPAKLRDILR